MYGHYPASYGPEHINAVERRKRPRFQARRGWTSLMVTAPEEHTFYPRYRRTWTFWIHGYPVVQLTGRLREKNY